MTKPKNLHVATILSAHGVRGDVRVRSLTDDPLSLFKYKPVTDESGAHVFALKRKGAAKDCFIVSIDGVEDRDAAEALRGTKLFVERSVLPKARRGEYYEADLIGLAAVDKGGQTCGVVQAMHDYGAGVFLEIQPVAGASFMLPFRGAFVPEVDLESNRIVVDIPDGWLDNGAQTKHPERKRP